MHLFFTFLFTCKETDIPLLCEIFPVTLPPTPYFLSSFCIASMSVGVLCYQQSSHNCFHPTISSLSLWPIRLCFSPGNRLQIHIVRSVHYLWTPLLHPQPVPICCVTILFATHILSLHGRIALAGSHTQQIEILFSNSFIQQQLTYSLLTDW